MKRLYDTGGGKGTGRGAGGLITLTVGPLEVNCYVVWDTGTRKAVVIDPGGDADAVEAEVRKNSLTVEHIVNTHGHFDHVGGDASLKGALGAPIAIHGLDSALMADAHELGG